MLGGSSITDAVVSNAKELEEYGTDAQKIIKYIINVNLQ